MLRDELEKLDVGFFNSGTVTFGSGTEASRWIVNFTFSDYRNNPDYFVVRVNDKVEPENSTVTIVRKDMEDIIELILFELGGCAGLSDDEIEWEIIN